MFEQDPGSLRMDLYLRERGDRLSVDTRLALLRQIGEALKHAHEKKVYHRALSPQSILIVEPDTAAPKIRIFNWQTGRREPGSSGPGGVGGTKTTHLGDLVEVVVPLSARDALAARRTGDAALRLGHSFGTSAQRTSEPGFFLAVWAVSAVA